ncbi:MAG: YvcK family protein [bacterium]|nr:YvcK family protein [bacterium]
MNKKSVVVIGGGTGVYAVLTSLKNKGVDLSAIVSMCDDGGSTGKLRDDYGTLPPGDIRRSLIALSSADKDLRKLFKYRFENGHFKGHSFGNLFLTACEMSEGNFKNAIKMASRVLNVQGKVIPVTLTKVTLCGQLGNGAVVRGETNIDIPKHNPDEKIVRLFTEPKARANPEALSAIRTADVLIVGPGDLKTSILPNFLMKGLPEAISRSRAKKIYVCNLMTKYGETNNYTAADFINEVEDYIGPLDFIIVNTKRPDKERLRKYADEKSIPVTIPSDFYHTGLIKNNVMTIRGYIRHDHKKLAKALMRIIALDSAATLSHNLPKLRSGAIYIDNPSS